MMLALPVPESATLRPSETTRALPALGISTHGEGQPPGRLVTPVMIMMHELLAGEQSTHQVPLGRMYWLPVAPILMICGGPNPASDPPGELGLAKTTPAINSP